LASNIIGTDGRIYQHPIVLPYILCGKSNSQVHCNCGFTDTSFPEDTAIIFFTSEREFSGFSIFFAIMILG